MAFSVGCVDKETLEPVFSRNTKLLSQTALINLRVGRVYQYTAGMFALSFASAGAFAATGLTLKMVSWVIASPYLSTFGLLALGISLLVTTHFTEKENVLQKQGFFGMFAVWQGLVISPLLLLNAPAFALAGVTTVGVAGGLGVLAMRLQESFEKYETILMVGLGAIALASLGTLCLPATAAAFSHKVSLIGGLALFSTFIIYDTHVARKEAANEEFDAINHSIGIYLDMMNLFLRIWELYDRNTN